MTVFLQPIYTQTVGSGGASSITFNNIPQGFADLKLEISARTAGAVTNTDWVMSFNNDGASVYSSTQTGTYTQRQSNNAYILGGGFTTLNRVLESNGPQDLVDRLSILNQVGATDAVALLSLIHISEPTRPY